MTVAIAVLSIWLGVLLCDRDQRAGNWWGAAWIAAAIVFAFLREAA